MGRENDVSGLSDGIRKMFLAGVGAMALTAEKSEQFLKTLVEKGEVVVDQSRESSEEAKRQRKEEKVKKSIDNIVNSLSDTDLEKLKEAIRIREEEPDIEEDDEEDLFDETSDASDKSDIIP